MTDFIMLEMVNQTLEIKKYTRLFHCIYTGSGTKWVAIDGRQRERIRRRWVHRQQRCSSCSTNRDSGTTPWRTWGLHEQWTTTIRCGHFDDSSTTRNWADCRVASVSCTTSHYASVQQGSAVADKPERRAASRRTCCKQTTWTLSVINLRPS